MKEIIFSAQAHKEIAKYPKLIRLRIAGLLDMLKAGLSLAPKDFKSIPAVGMGVYELRVRGQLQYRVFYVAKFKDAIYVLHAFRKKTQKTGQQDIEIGKSRYQQLIKERGKKT